MTQLKNAKVLPKGDKIFLIDAPEDKCRTSCQSSIGCRPDEKCRLNFHYQEALSKAPTWEIKNGDEILQKLWKSDISKDKPYRNFNDWQPEQGKLYDIPASYTYKIEKEPVYEFEGSPIGNEIIGYKEFVILIPQEDKCPTCGLSKKNLENPSFCSNSFHLPQEEPAPSHSSKTIENLLASITPEEQEKIDKEMQKQLLVDLMKTDQEHGMYEESQEDMWDEINTIMHNPKTGMDDRIEEAKSKFHITRR